LQQQNDRAFTVLDAPSPRASFRSSSFLGRGFRARAFGTATFFAAQRVDSLDLREPLNRQSTAGDDVRRT